MPAYVGTVESFAEFLLAWRVDQGHFGTLDDGDI